MKALADYLLTYKSFRDALVALGWKPPGVSTQGGGGPPAPPAPR